MIGELLDKKLNRKKVEDELSEEKRAEQRAKISSEAQGIFQRLHSELKLHLEMIMILSSVAQVAPLPMKMLRSIATPHHVRVLGELLIIGEMPQKVKIIELFTSLIKNKIPSKVFSDSMLEPLTQAAIDLPRVIFSENLENQFIKFLFNYAVHFRHGKVDYLTNNSSQLYAISKSLLKLVFFACDREEL